MGSLKTLKDIERNVNFWEWSLRKPTLELLQEIKEEAIKWVKYYDKESNWELLFKKFQNITEEDLNEDRR